MDIILTQAETEQILVALRTGADSDERSKARRLLKRRMARSQRVADAFGLTQNKNLED